MIKRIFHTPEDRRSRCQRFAAIAALFLASTAAASDWSAPVEIRHEDELSISYQAKLDGDLLLVKATIGPGWHTFSMDNQRRVTEKLAGKPAISNDRPTSIALSGGVEIGGPWFETPPKDFSHPELRWYSWGFEGHALFAAQVKRAASGPVKVAIRGQACTSSVCKNIELAITLPAGSLGGVPGVNLGELEQVR
jgi:DsbC/DsbD-like thiol-disulfide interchange protein